MGIMSRRRQAQVRKANSKADPEKVAGPKKPAPKGPQAKGVPQAKSQVARSR